MGLTQSISELVGAQNGYRDGKPHTEKRRNLWKWESQKKNEEIVEKKILTTSYLPHI